MKTPRNLTAQDFEDLRPLEDEATLLGTLTVFGTPYHFTFLEVVVVQDPEAGVHYRPVKDPHNRIEDVDALYDYPYQLTEIDGKLYVGWAHPHGD